MTFYKIRHIPTGLFYKPSKYGSKSNLSKNGKVYQKRPTMKHIGKTYHHPSNEGLWGFVTQHVIPGEWEIIEYTTAAVS